MIIPPGQKRFNTQQCRDWVEKCHHCQDGWLHVAYGIEDGKFSVYKFPCRKCTGHGYEWFELDNPELYRDRPVDYYATPAELPGYVFIHPSHKRGFEKIVKRIQQVRARIEAEQLDSPVPF